MTLQPHCEQRSSEIDLDWDRLRRQVEAGPRSAEATEACLWALDTLENQIGPGWPAAWKVPGAPPELVTCGSHLAGLAGTLDLALALHLLRDHPRLRDIRRAIRTSGRTDQLVSPRLQLRFAALALRAGVHVELEPTLEGRETPADLRLSSESVACGVEALAMLRDHKTLSASRWVDEVATELLLIGTNHGVNFQMAVEAPLSDDATTELLAQIEQRAACISRGLTLRDVRVGPVTARITPTADGGGAVRTRLPIVSFGKRLENKLKAKVDQTRRSGADWLLVDSFDHWWHLGEAGRQSLADKARQLAAYLRRLLANEQHLVGAVITDGAALMRPDAEEEAIEAGEGAVARCRRSDKWHVRESVVVPLAPSGHDGAELWRAVLNAESGWLGWAGDQAGLRQIPELTSVDSPAR